MASAIATGTVDLAALVHGMNRRALVYQLTHFDPGFKLDFTPEFIASQSNEQLRHILLAAHLQARRRQRSPVRLGLA